MVAKAVREWSGSDTLWEWRPGREHASLKPIKTSQNPDQASTSPRNILELSAA